VSLCAAASNNARVAAPSVAEGLLGDDTEEEDCPRYRNVDVFRGGFDKQQLLLLLEEDVDNELILLRSNVDRRTLLLEELGRDIFAQEEVVTEDDEAPCSDSPSSSI